MIICMSFTATKTGGEYVHTLTTDEIPKHKHGLRTDNTAGGGSAGVKLSWGTGYTSFSESQIQDSGGGKSHNNIQPYVVTYFWKRTI